MSKSGKQGYTVPAGPPRICACGRRFVPSIVVESGGAGRAYKCPACTAADKKAKRRRKQLKEEQ